MFGGDLPSNDDFTLSLLTNEEVLAVNQASENNRELFHRAGRVAWAADRPGTPDLYVALFNLTPPSPHSPAGEKVILDFSEIGRRGPCTVRDLWAGKELGEFSGRFAPLLPSHSAGLYRLGCRPAEKTEDP